MTDPPPPFDAYAGLRAEVRRRYPPADELFVAAYLDPAATVTDPETGEPLEATFGPYPDGDPAAAGERDRLRPVLEAVCRFLNTGGDPRKLAEAVVAVCRLPAPHLVPPGTVLVESGPDEDGGYTHVFADPAARTCVVWEEGAATYETDWTPDDPGG